MENRRKSEDNEMQLKTGRQAWKISKKRDFRKLFADPFRNAKISQTHFAMRKFTNPNSQCENFAMRNFAMPNAISQCQMPFRNANFEFTLPIPISQCENFANIKFAMRKFRNAKFRNAKAHFALRKSLPLRNSPCEIYRPCHPM